MNPRLHRILGVTIMFGIMGLILIAQSGMRIVEDYLNPRPPPKIEVVEPTPVINVPTPSKGYFVECMHDDLAVVVHHDEVYYCTCERGKWVYDKDNRNRKFPKPQKHDSGTL